MEREDKKTLILAAVAITLIVLLYGIGKFHGDIYTEGESRNIARTFVKNSATYQFDGFSLEYKDTLYPDIAGCENCYTFVFGFESRHSGYGNRTGQMLAQVITPHEAHVTVEDGRVRSANLDDKWDMVEQREINLKD